MPQGACFFQSHFEDMEDGVQEMEGKPGICIICRKEFDVERDDPRKIYRVVEKSDRANRAKFCEGYENTLECEELQNECVGLCPECFDGCARLAEAGDAEWWPSNMKFVNSVGNQNILSKNDSGPTPAEENPNIHNESLPGPIPGTEKQNIQSKNHCGPTPASENKKSRNENHPGPIPVTEKQNIQSEDHRETVPTTEKQNIQSEDHRELVPTTEKHNILNENHPEPISATENHNIQSENPLRPVLTTETQNILNKNHPGPTPASENQKTLNENHPVPIPATENHNIQRENHLGSIPAIKNMEMPENSTMLQTNSEYYETAADVEMDQIPSKSRALSPRFMREENNETDFALQNHRGVEISDATQIAPVSENLPSLEKSRDAGNCREVDENLDSIEDIGIDMENSTAAEKCTAAENLAEAGGTLPDAEYGPAADAGNHIQGSQTNRMVMEVNPTERGVNFKIEISLSAYRQRNMSLARFVFEAIGDKVVIEGDMNAATSNNNPNTESAQHVDTTRNPGGSNHTIRIPDLQNMEQEQSPETEAREPPEENQIRKHSQRKIFFVQRLNVGNRKFPPRKKQFKCISCGHEFKSKQYLLKHREVRAGEKEFQCLVCKTRCPRKICLLKHQRNLLHYQTTPPTCDICLKRFLSKINMMKHRKTHETKTATLKAKSADRLNLQNVNKNSNSRVCRLSSAINSKVSEPILQNVNCNSNSRVSRSSTDSIEKSVHRCQKCGNQFMNQLQLEGHIRDVHKKMKCTLCGQLFKQSVIAQHVQEAHLESPQHETTYASSTE